jgi:hypothetical protein
MKWWFFFALINIFWLVYVFIFNIRWSILYGPNIFSEPQGPFPSGGFFLLLFIFFFNLFIFYYSKLKILKIKKITILILCLLPALGTFWSGSMASTLGLFFSMSISIFLLYKDRINLLSIFKISILGVLTFIILILSIQTLPVPQKIISSKKIIYEYTSGSSNSRGGILKNNLKIILSSPLSLIIGVGIKGEAHSQYMRVILERGIIGLFLFFWLIWSILNISYNGFKEREDLFKKGLSAGLFIATITMLVMSIPNDPFMVVKIAEVYWFFNAITMTTILTSQKSI